MLLAVLPMIFTSTGVPSGAMIVVLFASLPMMSRPVVSEPAPPCAVDAHRINIPIRKIFFLKPFAPFYN
jgi:hypothetical protein